MALSSFKIVLYCMNNTILMTHQIDSEVVQEHSNIQCLNQTENTIMYTITGTIIYTSAFKEYWGRA